MLKEEIGEICKALYAKILYSLIKTYGIYIKDLNIYEDIRDNAYMNFFAQSYKDLAYI